MITIGQGTIGIIIFVILQILKYILHKFQYVFLLQSNNKFLSILESSIYTAFDIIILKNLAGTSIEIALIASLVANGIATYLSMLYSEKHLIEKVFEYEIVLRTDEDAGRMEDILIEKRFKYLRQTGTYKMMTFYVFTVRAYDKNGSKILNNIIDEMRNGDISRVRYTVITTNTIREDNKKFVEEKEN